MSSGFGSSLTREAIEQYVKVRPATESFRLRQSLDSIELGVRDRGVGERGSRRAGRDVAGQIGEGGRREIGGGLDDVLAVGDAYPVQLDVAIVQGADSGDAKIRLGPGADGELQVVHIR